MKWEKPVMSALGDVGPCHDPCPTRITFEWCGVPSILGCSAPIP